MTDRHPDNSRAKGLDGARSEGAKPAGCVVNPVKAIRTKCLDCCGYMPSVVADCHIVACTLHPFRMGKNPFRKTREKTDAEREAMAARLAAHRLAKSTIVATENEENGGLQ